MSAIKLTSMPFVVAAVVILMQPAFAQTRGADKKALSFEVASIKINTSGTLRQTTYGMQPGGRYTAINLTLGQLIRQAYQLQEYQLTGGPNWLNDTRFDVVAKADRPYKSAQLPLQGL